MMKYLYLLQKILLIFFTLLRHKIQYLLRGLSYLHKSFVFKKQQAQYFVNFEVDTQ